MTCTRTGETPLMIGQACLAALGILLTAWAAAGAQAPGPLDWADVVEVGRYYVRPARPEKDVKTGFVVGGKNATDVIRKVTELNGRTIAELEKDMRPGAKAEVGTSKGFLGAE